MPIEGDFAGLEQLENLLRWAESDNMRIDLSDHLGHKALELVQEGFAKEQDPYGTSWEPKKYHNGRKILVASGDMQASYEVDIKKDGFRITNDVPYAGFHQSGTDHMPARKTIPDDGTLGRWEGDLREAAIDFLVEKMGRVR